jgi:polygalacturonase
LHLDAGAIIDFSKNHKDYTLSGSKPVPLISGTNLTNVAVTGEGVINGSGDTWRPVKKNKLPESQWKSLVASGGKVENDIWYPTQQVKDGKASDVRPNLMDIANSKSILIDGPTLENSPAFNLDIRHDQDVIIRHTQIMNEWYDQNTDGIDVNGKNIVIYRNIVNTGDDGICMKSSGGGRDGEPGLQNVVIEDNVVNHAHGGFVVGSNTDGGIKTIYVHNNVFSGTDTGLRFKSAVGAGGLVQDIWIDGITMKNIATDAITFDVNYPIEKNSKLDMSKVPQFRNIHINHVVADGAKQAVDINGTEVVPIGGVDIRNSVFQADKGVIAQYASGIQMTNVSILPATGPVFTLQNSDHVTLDKITYPSGTDTFLKLDGAKTQHIQLTNTDASSSAHLIEAGEQVPGDAVSTK